MQPSEKSGVAGGKELNPERELLSRRAVGIITVVIVCPPMLIALLLVPHEFTPSVSEFMDWVVFWSSLLCFLWGLLIVRTRRWWAWACIIEGLLTFATLVLAGCVR